MLRVGENRIVAWVKTMVQLDLTMMAIMTTMRLNMTNSIVVEVKDGANNSAKRSVQVVRMQRDTLTPADAGTSLIIGLVCLMIGFTVSLAVLWAIRQRRNGMTVTNRKETDDKHDRVGSSTPRDSEDGAPRRGGQG